jgi:hypothetical protein
MPKTVRQLGVNLVPFWHQFSSQIAHSKGLDSKLGKVYSFDIFGNGNTPQYEVINGKKKQLWTHAP